MSTRVYWDCGSCGWSIEHRWKEGRDGDDLIFACKNKKQAHAIERRIMTLKRFWPDTWLWAVPIGQVICMMLVVFWT